jgi:hypothetical protein
MFRDVGAAPAAAVKLTSKVDGWPSAHWLGDSARLAVTPVPLTLKADVLAPLSESLQMKLEPLQGKLMFRQYPIQKANSWAAPLLRTDLAELLQ